MEPTSAAPAAFDPAGYPVQAEVVTPAQLDRWRVLQWIAAIPHFAILYVLRAALQVVAIIAWFAILFTGRYPEGLWDFSVGVMRWEWRASTYALFLHAKYPPFQLDSGEQDPGSEPALFAVSRPTERNRLTCALRIIWAIPAAFMAAVVGIGAAVVAVIGWFVVLFTGQWPDGMRSFLVRALRLEQRFTAYQYLLVDEYPPFSLDA